MSKRIAVVLVIVVFLLSSCTNGPQEQQEDLKLKVLSWNARIFNEQYGNFFRATHPDYDLQVVSITESLEAGEDLNQAVEKLIAEEDPDVVSLNMDFYEMLKDREELASLTPLIKKDKFSTADYSPAVLDYFTDEQDQIYGLTPTFIGSSLYYNKQIFDENGIPYPTDAMSWDNMFLLAQKIPNSSGANTPQYGFYDKYYSNPFMMALNIGESSGLSFYTRGKFLFQSQSWDNIFQEVTDCFRSKACFANNPNTSSSNNSIESSEKSIYPFLEGNIAMSVNDSSLYRLLKGNQKRYAGLDWGIVSLPVSSEQPDLGNGIQMNDIFSIPKNADVNAAWAFIKYICGEDYAKLLPHINAQDLPARMPDEWEDENLKTFYHSHRISNTTIQTLRSLPKTVISKMDNVSERYMTDILSAQTTVPEALKMIESELQKTLDGISE